MLKVKIIDEPVLSEWSVSARKFENEFNKEIAEIEKKGSIFDIKYLINSNSRLSVIIIEYNENDDDLKDENNSLKVENELLKKKLNNLLNDKSIDS